MKIKFDYAKHAGMTFAYLFVEDVMVATGRAYCHPNDRFSKRVGRKLAYTRLVNGLYPEDKAERKELWGLFLEKVKP